MSVRIDDLQVCYRHNPFLSLSCNLIVEGLEIYNKHFDFFIQNSVDASKAEIVKLREERKDISVQATVMKKEVSQLREKLGTQTSELTLKDIRAQEVESQLADLQSKIKHLEQDLVRKESARKDDIADLEEQVATAEARLVEMEAQLASKEKAVVSLTESQESMAQRHYDQQSSLEQANNLLKSHSSEKSDLEKSLEQVREKLASVEEASGTVKKELEHQLEKLQQEVEFLQKKCEAQINELAQNKTLLCTLTEERDSIKFELEGGTLKYSTSITGFEQKLATVNSQLASTEQTLIDKTSQYESCSDTLSVTLSEKEQLEEKNKQLIATVKTLQMEVATNQTELQEKEELLSQLHSSIKLQKEAQNSETEKDISALKSGFASRERALTEEISLLSAANEKLTNERNDIQLQHDRESNTVQANMKMLQDGILEKIAALSKSDKEKAKLSDRVLQLEKSDKELRDLKRNITEKKKVISTMEKENQALKKETQQQKDRNTKMGETYERLIQEHQSQIEKLGEEAIELQATLDTVNSKYTCAIENQKLTDEKLLLLEKSNASFRQKLASDSKAHKTSREKDRAAKAQLEDEVEESNRQNDRRRKLIDQLTQENNGYISENKRLKENLAALEETDGNDYERLCSDLATEKALSIKLSQQVQALKAEVAESRLASPRSSVSSFKESPSTSLVSVCLTNTNISSTKPLLRSKKKSLSKSPADEKDRLRELKQRNKQSLPHLKSSYPIEMQMKQETSSMSDNSLKNIVKTEEAVPVLKIGKGARMRVSDPPWRRHKEGCKAESRKRGREATDESDQSSSITDSTPPTPYTSANRYKRKTSGGSVPIHPLKLRGFLDDKKTVKEPSGTAFDVSFPRSKDKLVPVPKRFRGDDAGTPGTSTTVSGKITKKTEVVAVTRRSTRITPKKDPPQKMSKAPKKGTPKKETPKKGTPKKGTPKAKK